MQILYLDSAEEKCLLSGSGEYVLCGNSPALIGSCPEKHGSELFRHLTRDHDLAPLVKLTGLEQRHVEALDFVSSQYSPERPVLF